MLKIAALLQRILPPVWLGMIFAIAMEAQLKFQAPGITRELGLGIGKLVFTALNRAEIIIALLLVAAFIFVTSNKKAQMIFSVILLILLAQTFWLIPALIEKIDLITEGQTPPDSSIHLIYVALEVGKILLLLGLSVSVNLPDLRLKK